MRLSKLLQWIGFFTVIALVYIHMQMNIIHLAYEGKNKEKTIRSLIEENGHLTYNILSTKSSANLGYKLLNEDSDMDFVGSQNVLLVSTPEDILLEDIFPVSQKKKNFLLSLLSFGAQAEAKGQE